MWNVRILNYPTETQGFIFSKISNRLQPENTLLRRWNSCVVYTQISVMRLGRSYKNKRWVPKRLQRKRTFTTHVAARSKRVHAIVQFYDQYKK